MKATAKRTVAKATTTTEPTIKVKFGKFDPASKLRATGKKVTSEDNNARVKSVNGKTVKDALASGLYTATDLNYDINKIKTLEIV